jgi:hypothetical protein
MSRIRPVPELTLVHKAYKLALSQEPVTSSPVRAVKAGQWYIQYKVETKIR